MIRSGSIQRKTLRVTYALAVAALLAGLAPAETRAQATSPAPGQAAPAAAAAASPAGIAAARKARRNAPARGVEQIGRQLASIEARLGADPPHLALYPNDKLAGNAQYWLGEMHYARGDYKGAADAYLKGYKTYQKSDKAPDTLLKLGMSLAALGQKQKACSTFGELDAKYPKAPEAVRAQAKSERARAGC